MNDKITLFCNKAMLLSISPLKYSLLFILFLFFCSTHFLYSQSGDNEQLFARRLVWGGGEHALRFLVEIDKQEDGNYREFLREFTATLYIVVSLPAGEYRFRIIPYDILDRPHEGTDWVRFQVRNVIRPVVTGTQVEVIDISNYSEEEEQDTEITESNKINEKNTDSDMTRRFNALGISLGSSTADPVLSIALRGVFSPARNFYCEIGFDFGLISKDIESIDSYWSMAPFFNIGFFAPLGDQVGLFVGAGVGYQAGTYSVSTQYENQDHHLVVFATNFTAGVILWDWFNISYMLKTDFISRNHTFLAGYTYRF